MAAENAMIPVAMPIVDWMVREKVSRTIQCDHPADGLVQRREDVVAAGLVGDRLVDDRLGEDPREGEAEDSRDDAPANLAR
jgi:hypothetical protein